MGIALPAQESLGVGLYSYADAARFIGGSSSELRRWLKGYQGRKHGNPEVHPPLWKSQWADSEIDGIGFRDLIELRFVRTFVACGVPLNLVRRTIVELNERLGKEYPFTSTSFKTDGRRIFMELVGDSGDAALVDVVKRQDVMRKVIAPSLREGIELGIDDRAERWFPLKGSRAVVFDPQRSFGQPILSESGVPTVAIVEAMQAEGGDERRVARLYDLPLAAVKKALQFENRAAP
ncbi:DUF433 domain-containing protein [Stenotrophomonas sp. ZAC14D2_NAIMI4_6]|uniref:DUF433 domain-containing protein n=1 Tax=Stenotrophomonas sp. ZAC14D2_NAIMI4_6 TaxID=2072406 RepID=UPI000D5422C1|nr:DUF433 domain-containing protein [Stenotrophomonas sp. ZAC14D2_NAIMI4_6]AWH23128.1 DUF433 domain-containing protein [Stenotrophomonas sp. ZAC14D2_NAIMI4_6]